MNCRRMQAMFFALYNTVCIIFDESPWMCSDYLQQYSYNIIHSYSWNTITFYPYWAHIDDGNNKWNYSKRRAFQVWLSYNITLLIPTNDLYPDNLTIFDISNISFLCVHPRMKRFSILQREISGWWQEARWRWLWFC